MAHNKNQTNTTAPNLKELLPTLYHRGDFERLLEELREAESVGNLERKNALTDRLSAMLKVCRIRHKPYGGYGYYKGIVSNASREKIPTLETVETRLLTALFAAYQRGIPELTVATPLTMDEKDPYMKYKYAVWDIGTSAGWENESDFALWLGSEETVAARLSDALGAEAEDLRDGIAAFSSYLVTLDGLLRDGKECVCVNSSKDITRSTLLWLAYREHTACVRLYGTEGKHYTFPEILGQIRKGADNLLFATCFRGFDENNVLDAYLAFSAYHFYLQMSETQYKPEK